RRQARLLEENCVGRSLCFAPCCLAPRAQLAWCLLTSASNRSRCPYHCRCAVAGPDDLGLPRSRPPFESPGECECTLRMGRCCRSLLRRSLDRSAWHFSPATQRLTSSARPGNIHIAARPTRARPAAPDANRPPTVPPPL